MDALTIEADHEGHEYVIRCAGELDESCCAALESALLRAEASSATRILLDLGGLEFMDSGGLRLLVAAQRRSAADSDRLRMTRPRGEVARLFELTALDRTMPFV